jgi:serine/threonine protein kinase
MNFAPGLVVAGRYRLVRMVGAGGMGEVWASEEVATLRRVALKRLLPTAAKHHEVVARFKREAYLLGRIQSPYVARVIDFLDDEQFGLVISMEYIEGPSLAQVLDKRSLSVEESLDLATDVLRALVDLHSAKIVHRDLKPGNIIMSRTPRPGDPNTDPNSMARPRAVIVDFGISRILTTDGDSEVTGITRANIALGTVEYMAPEQILNSRDVTPVTDLYALGIILFRAVCGRHAFGDRRGEEVARAKLIEDAPGLDSGRSDAVAVGLAQIVARALKKRPAQRFASAAEMLAEVERVQSLGRTIDLDDTTTDGSTSIADVEPSREGSPTVREALVSVPPGAFAAAQGSFTTHPDDPRRQASEVSGRSDSFASSPAIAQPPPQTTSTSESSSGSGVAVPREPVGSGVDAKAPSPRALIAIAVVFAFASGIGVGVFAAFNRGDDESSSKGAPTASQAAGSERPSMAASPPAVQPTTTANPDANPAPPAPAPADSVVSLDLDAPTNGAPTGGPLPRGVLPAQSASASPSARASAAAVSSATPPSSSSSTSSIPTTTSVPAASGAPSTPSTGSGDQPVPSKANSEPAVDPPSKPSTDSAPKPTSDAPPKAPSDAPPKPPAEGPSPAPPPPSPPSGE